MRLFNLKLRKNIKLRIESLEISIQEIQEQKSKASLQPSVYSKLIMTEHQYKKDIELLKSLL